MTRRVAVRPQARIDVIEAQEWYDNQADGLGQRFLKAFDAALDRIIRNPAGYQLIHGKARRTQLHRFPYGIIYSFDETEIVIYACFHGARDPARWKSRL